MLWWWSCAKAGQISWYIYPLLSFLVPIIRFQYFFNLFTCELSLTLTLSASGWGNDSGGGKKLGHAEILRDSQKSWECSGWSSSLLLTELFVFFKNFCNCKPDKKFQGVMYLLLLSMSAHLTKELGMAPGGEFRRCKFFVLPTLCLLLCELHIKIGVCYSKRLVQGIYWGYESAWVQSPPWGQADQHHIEGDISRPFARWKRWFLSTAGSCCSWACTEVTSWVEYSNQQRLNHKVGLLTFNWIWTVSKL